MEKHDKQYDHFDDGFKNQSQENKIQLYYRVYKRNKKIIPIILVLLSLVASLYTIYSSYCDKSGAFEQNEVIIDIKQDAVTDMQLFTRAHWTNPRVGVLVTFVLAGLGIGVSAWFAWGTANLAWTIGGIALGVVVAGYGTAGAVYSNLKRDADLVNLVNMSTSQLQALHDLVGKPVMLGNSKRGLDYITGISVNPEAEIGNITIANNIMLNTTYGVHYFTHDNDDLGQVTDDIVQQINEGCIGDCYWHKMNQDLTKRAQGFTANWVSWNYVPQSGNLAEEYYLQLNGGLYNEAQANIQSGIEYLMGFNVYYKFCMGSRLSQVDDFCTGTPAYAGEVYFNTFGGVDGECQNGCLGENLE